MLIRPRRNRSSQAVRDMVAETTVSAADLVLPLFVLEGEGVVDPIKSMPGVDRLSIDKAAEVASIAYGLGIRAVALFPVISESLKDATGSEGCNPDGLIPRAIEAIKEAESEIVVITDVALDPYSSDGHDGVVVDGRIDNDRTLPLLAEMALIQAAAGADIVAPSDMMDGRVRAIREKLEEAGLVDVGILSYCAKYASGFYGPFRDALDSAPRFGDKKTYQMNPANVREALREIALDEAEGADILMVKPGLPYLDVIASMRRATTLPIATYHVSGEYAMLCAAAERGWLDFDRCLMESLTCLKRAGADMIFTYGAIRAAELLK